MSSDQNAIEEIDATRQLPGASWKDNETHRLPENRLSVVGFSLIIVFDCYQHPFL